jgi:TetR/AcrR family transcriptional regulator, transcriptional repressor for nem operon
MDTKAQIIELGDQLMREKGYNAFSFSDISKALQIRNASIHYHFPTKTALGVAIVQEHLSLLEQLISKSAGKSPLEQLQAFLGIYSKARAQNRICLVGSLATDLYTVEAEIQTELKKLVTAILDWVTGILQAGKRQGIFHFTADARTKALMIITNMLAAVQLTRLTNKQDFQRIKENVINELIQKAT